MTAAAVAVRSRPIPFTGSMVRAILDDRKGATRRLATLPPEAEVDNYGHPFLCRETDYGWTRVGVPCPHGEPGDRLWVKEGLRRGEWGCVDNSDLRDDAVYYAADGEPMWDLDSPARWVWKRPTLPSMFCPRGASRLTLEITRTRVERLQDISYSDCRAEGLPEPRMFDLFGMDADERRTLYASKYRELWDSLNAKRGCGWDANPLVWVIEFTRVRA